MTHNSEDLRVRRTRKLLREALISLIESEGRSFDAITVGEIAERAMVSRAAFYRYYQDKYDLVEHLFEETVQSMIVELDTWRKEVLEGNHPLDPTELLSHYQEYVDNQEVPHAAWIMLFEHIAEHERLYRALLGEKGSPWFAKKMRTYLAEQIASRAERIVFDPSARPLSDQRVMQEGFVPMILAGLLIDAIRWWLEENRPYTSKQIAVSCHRLIIANLREVNRWG